MLVITREAIDGLIADESDPWVSGTARAIRAHALLNAGEKHVEAEADFRVALAAFRSIGERWGLSFTLCSLADLVASRVWAEVRRATADRATPADPGVGS